MGTDANGAFVVFGIAISTTVVVSLLKICAVVVAGIAAIAIVNQPQVKQGISTAISSTTDSISNTIADVKENIKAKREIKDDDPRIHHIVAQGDHRAAHARAILEQAGINPKTDPRNLITISQGFHKSMHTNNYYTYVENKLLNCGSAPADIERALWELKITVYFAEKTGIKVWDLP